MRGKKPHSRQSLFTSLAAKRSGVTICCRVRVTCRPVRCSSREIGAVIHAMSGCVCTLRKAREGLLAEAAVDEPDIDREPARVHLRGLGPDPGVGIDQPAQAGHEWRRLSWSVPRSAAVSPISRTMAGTSASYRSGSLMRAPPARGVIVMARSRVSSARECTP